VVEFSRSGQEKTEQGRVLRRKTGTFKMKFTGTLIEDLMATVERAEQRAQADGSSPVEGSAVEPLLVESLVVETMFVESSLVETSLVGPLLVEPWFASVQENLDYDSKLFGVA